MTPYACRGAFQPIIFALCVLAYLVVIHLQNIHTFIRSKERDSKRPESNLHWFVEEHGEHVMEPCLIRLTWFYHSKKLALSHFLRSAGLLVGVVGDWQEELELWWEFLLGIQAVGEINTPDTAVSMQLHSEGFDVVGSIGTPRKVGQIELNLIPTLVQSHRHGANEGLHSGGALIETKHV